MLLYLANPSLLAPENALHDLENNPVYVVKTRCVWKSESPAVPAITQTDIVDAQSNTIIAQIDWDGSKPIYIDFGDGDERVMSDMLYPKTFNESQLAFQTPGDLRWTLTRKSMELQSELASGALARFLPSSRVAPDGKLEFVPSNPRSRNTIAKDWLELNLIEFSPLSVAELLVDFIILEALRRVNFWIPDSEPIPITPSTSLPSTTTIPATKARSRSSTGPSLPRLRLRQAVS